MNARVWVESRFHAAAKLGEIAQNLDRSLAIAEGDPVGAGAHFEREIAAETAFANGIIGHLIPTRLPRHARLPRRTAETRPARLPRPTRHRRHAALRGPREGAADVLPGLRLRSDGLRLHDRGLARQFLRALI